LVADRLVQAIDSIRHDTPQAKMVIVGDFNDEATSPALLFLADHDLHNVTADAKGMHGAEATYYYQGEWGSIDHVLVSAPLVPLVERSFVNDSPFLLEEDKKYGGVKPFRTYYGMRYQHGFSDHLPLVVQFRLPPIQ
jgi:Predicted extracellular nuclease